LAASLRDPKAGAGILGRFRSWPLLLPILLIAPAPLAAQQPAVAELNGRVLANGQPSSAALVVFHRVGPEGSGPIDSLRAGADGSFRYRLPRVPDPASQEVYFASVVRDGVNYFGPLISTAAELDSTYVITSFDTATAPPAGVPVRLAMRALLLEEVPSVGWTATDLLHIVQEGDRTLVAAPGGATFVYPLPEGATDLEIGGNQMSPDAATLAGGSLRITSALPPGEREVVVRYRLPDPFVTVRYPGTTAEAELLVKEPAPPLEVEGLAAVPPVEMEPGTSYRRYAGANLQDLSVVIREGEGDPLIPTRWLAVALALLLAGAALYAVLRPHPAVAGAPAAAAPVPLGITPFERRQRLLLEVARLDEARDSGRITNADEWAAHRRALLERLRELG
jgi:hypothetical protein